MEGNKVIFHSDTFSNSYSSYKNKKIKVIVDNEEVYIANIVLPKIDKEIIRLMINDELSLRFKNTDNIMFDYFICKKTKKNIEVAVLCFNWNRGNLLENIVKDGGILKGIYPLQFYILEKYRNKINGKNFYFIFLYENSLYIIAAVNGVVIMNKVIKNLDVTSKINFRSYSDKIKHVYYANLNEKFLADYLDEDFCYINLGPINTSNIFG